MPTTDEQRLLFNLDASAEGMRTGVDRGIAVLDVGAKKMEQRALDATAKIERVFGSLKLENDLGIAKIKGDDAAVAALQRQMELTKEIGRLRRAGASPEEAETKANALLAERSAALEAQRVAAAAAGAEQERVAAELALTQRGAAVEQIALEQKLEVARARGERREVESLEEELALAKAIAHYRSIGFGEGEAQQMAGSHMSTLAGARRAAKQGNIGEAIEGTFSRARLGVLEEGGARIGIFGGALESLGPAGIAAGAGLLAFFEGMEKAKQAGEWAEGIEQSAGKLGVSLQKMQQLDFAGASIGLKPDELRQQLDGLNEILGKMQAGEPRAKIFMKELGLTPAQVLSFKDVGDFMPVLADHLKNAGSAAEQANIAKRGGFDLLLPLLRQGSAGFDELADEAQKAGIVLEDGTVRSAAKATEKLHEMEAEIGGELRAAFINLAPEVEKVAEFIEHCTRAIAGLLKDIPDAIKGLQDLGGAFGKDAPDHKQDLLDKADTALANSGFSHFTDGDLHIEKGAFKGLAENGRVDRLKEGIAGLVEGKKSDVSSLAPDEGGVPTVLLPPHGPKPKKPKAAPHDPTEEFDKAAADARDDGAKALAAAQAALTKNIQARADAEKRAIDVETDKKLTDLGAEEAKIRKAKNDAHSAQQLAALDTAKTDARSAATAKKDLIDREAVDAELAIYEKHQATLNSYLSATASVMASMAKTAAARNQIERANLKADQTRELQAFDSETDKNKRDGLYDGPEGQADYKDRLGERAALVGQQGAQTQKQTYDQAGPLQQFNRQLGVDTDQAGQKLAVKSITAMNDALVQGFQNWKNFGQAAKGAIQGVLGDMIKLELEKAELAAAPGVSSLLSAAGGGITSSLGSLFGGAHAAGGTIPAGKVGLVGEKGAELAVGGSSGTQIVPADITSNVLGAMGGLMAAGPAAGARSSSSISIRNEYNLTGAVSEGAVRGWIAQGDNNTLSQASSYFRQNIGSEFSRFNALEG